MSLTKEEITEKLEDIRPHPIDKEYTKPAQGGCWICRTGNGWEEHNKFEFEVEFGVFYHPDCLDEISISSLTELHEILNNEK